MAIKIEVYGGDFEGLVDGDFVGLKVGDFEGLTYGDFVGLTDGYFIGLVDNDYEGVADGDFVGLVDGGGDLYGGPGSISSTNVKYFAYVTPTRVCAGKSGNDFVPSWVNIKYLSSSIWSSIYLAAPCNR